MQWTWAVRFQSFHVNLGSVALVFLEAILRVLVGLRYHEPVPLDLCDNAGRRNRKAQRIAPYDGSLGYGEPSNLKAVNQHPLRPLSQAFCGSFHGQMSGTKNVQAVDLGNISDG